MPKREGGARSARGEGERAAAGYRSMHLSAHMTFGRRLHWSDRSMHVLCMPRRHKSPPHKCLDPTERTGLSLRPALRTRCHRLPRSSEKTYSRARSTDNLHQPRWSWARALAVVWSWAARTPGRPAASSAAKRRVSGVSSRHRKCGTLGECSKGVVQGIRPVAGAQHSAAGLAAGHSAAGEKRQGG